MWAIASSQEPFIRESDRQVDPKALTHALVAACQQRGVTFRFDAEVCGFDLHSDASPSTHFHLISTASESFKANWVIIAAGLGATGLTHVMQHPVDIRPVLGQAMRVRVPLSHEESNDKSKFQPVLTGNDIHVIPLDTASLDTASLDTASLDTASLDTASLDTASLDTASLDTASLDTASLDTASLDTAEDYQDYWVGATVEFPDNRGAVTTDATLFKTMWDGAIAFYPALAGAEIQEQWSGKRPRPFGRPAPIVEAMAGYSQVILAAGHYRNGVLLAPATARLVKELMGY